MKLPHGTHVKPEQIQNFYEICRTLEADFSGALRLIGVKNGQTYYSDILVDMGVIIAASFKYSDSLEILSRDYALSFIRNNLAGSSGKLDIFKFDSDEMTRAIEHNGESLLEKEIRIQDLGVKITSNIVKKKQAGVGLFSKIRSAMHQPDANKKQERIKQIKGLRDDVTPFSERSELDFGRVREAQAKPVAQESSVVAPLVRPDYTAPKKAVSEPVKPAKKEAGSSPVKKPAGSQELPEEKARKEVRLKRIKEERLKKITERVSKTDDGKPVKKIVEGMKVETTIDKLYELILDKGSVRIGDEVSRKLKVPKSQIEEWAMILEEHNLVELHYPAIGEPELRKLHKEKK